MKTAFFAILLSVLSNTLHAQDRSFQNLIDQTNDYLNHYSKLTPSSGMNLPLNQLPFTKQEIDTIREENDFDGLITPGKDSIDESALIWVYQEKIIDNLYKILKHKSFVEKDITRLLVPYIRITKSPDNKLFDFSIDENTGGTYRSSISIVYFTDLDEPSSSFNGDLTSPYSGFPKDGCWRIDTIQAKEGTKYLIQGGVAGCSTCYEENISLVKFENNAFVQEFYYSVFLRIDHGGITYDPETKTIHVSYTTDDLTERCNCASKAEQDDENSYYDAERCECVFKFNGSNFELVK